MIIEASFHHIQDIAFINHLVRKEQFSKFFPPQYVSTILIDRFTKNWKKKLEQEQSKTYLYEIDNRSVGFISLLVHAQNTIEISELYVHPKYQNQGIGKALLQSVADKYSGPFFLYSLAENNQANFFYDKMGRIRDGSKTHCFGNTNKELIKFVMS